MEERKYSKVSKKWRDKYYESRTQKHSVDDFARIVIKNKDNKLVREYAKMKGLRIYAALSELVQAGLKHIAGIKDD